MAKNCPMTQKGILLDLQQALAAERLAYDGYSELNVVLEDPKDQEKIERIVADEKKHIKIVEELIKITKEYYQN